MRILLIATVSFLLIASDCGSRETTLNTYLPIYLGYEKNNYHIEKVIFLGHRVESFRLRLRYRDGNNLTNWPTITRLTFDTPNGQTQIINEFNEALTQGNSFWTDQFINTNQVNLTISSIGAFIEFDGSAPRFEILEVDYLFKDNSNKTSVPSTDELDSNSWYEVDLKKEIIGIFVDVGEAHHYKLNRNGFEFSLFHNVYLSPLQNNEAFPTLADNDIGIKAFLSRSEFKPINDRSNWLTPEDGDTGIYHEFIFKDESLYLTVKSDLAAPYFFTQSKLKTFGSISMEYDDNIPSPFYYDSDIYDFLNYVFHPKQVDDYLADVATVRHRINEFMVVSSAYLLDATEGQFRFSNADLYRGINPFRDVDVQFTNEVPSGFGDSRANGGPFHINLKRVNLEDMWTRGPFTFIHEWGHWEFGLDDEYIVSESEEMIYNICPNSVMAIYGTEWLRTEFCDMRNHISQNENGSINPNSAWQKLHEKYNLPNNSYPYYRPNFQGLYTDVLHKLDQLFELEIKN